MTRQEIQIDYDTVVQLQKRLSEFGYYSGSIEGKVTPETIWAIQLFQARNRLEATGAPNPETLQYLQSNEALPSPHPTDTKEFPIDEDEDLMHARLAMELTTIESAEERQQKIAELVLRFGPRFVAHISNAAENFGSSIPHLIELAEEANHIFLTWLTGKSHSKQVDEDERRRAATDAILRSEQLISRFGRLLAQSILSLPNGHPQRDEGLAHYYLLRFLHFGEVNNDVESQLLALRTLLLYGLESPQRELDLIQTGQQLTENCSDRDIALEYLGAEMGVYIRRAIMSREQGNRGNIQKWAAKTDQIYLQIRDHAPEIVAKYLVPLAMVKESLDQFAESADLFAEAARGLDPQGDLYHQACFFEGMIRLRLEEYDRAIQILEPIIPYYEERYLTAVQDSNIQDSGDKFNRAITNLAMAYASKGQWNDAIYYLEHGKSLRLRYRAALRSTEKGQELLHLERALHALSRGVLVNLDGLIEEKPFDKLGEMVSLHTRVLEAYRTARPGLTAEVIKPPTILELSSSLDPDEALVIIGEHFMGVILIIILPGDETRPTFGTILKEWSYELLRPLIVGEDKRGWLAAVAGAQTDRDTREILSDYLSDMDKVIGKPIVSQIDSYQINHLHIIPHRLFHILPFWALPSLKNYEIAISPSAAHFRESKAPASFEKKAALVVSNPILDLPISQAEAQSIQTHLSSLDVQIHHLEKDAATQTALNEILPGIPIFHFSGHGLFNAIQPTQSCLLVHPDFQRLLSLEEEIFAKIGTADLNWNSMGERERYADVPDLGRVYYQLKSIIPYVEERWFEYAEDGTFWWRMENEQLAMMAELWTVGDIMVDDTMRDCKLAFLSACESGSGQLSAVIDEHAGLPAALQLAGVPIIVSTLWPVSEILAAIYVDIFYELFASSSTEINIVRIVRDAARLVREMAKEDVVKRLKGLRHNLQDSRARFAIEAATQKIRNGEEYPFSHPYDWAAFYITGSRFLTIE